MARNLSNPKVLLLQAAVEHQRVENKFSSLEPIILQVRKQLRLMDKLYDWQIQVFTHIIQTFILLV